MGRIARLICVTSDNNNKYYNMEEHADGSFTCHWGRVDVTDNVTTYPSSKGFDRQLQSKVKKGYKDVTSLRVIAAATSAFASLGTDEISRLVEELQRYAKQSVQQNYTVSSEAVTQRQVEEAQRTIDDIIPLIKRGTKTEIINQLLLELYKIIPRRMGNVRDHLIEFPIISSSKNQDAVDHLIANEQATLDVLQGQVQVNTVQQAQTQTNQQTILQAMGIEIFQTQPSDVDMIKKLLGGCSNQYRRSFIVVNKKTQAAFDKFVAKAKEQRRRLFWHGSRNENWWSIISSGLVLRPSNAVITGKYFGYGIYFADKARKSIGYCSLQGSYWARGSSNKGFLSLYDVHVGNSFRIKHHEQWCFDLTESKLKARGQYDSLFAEGGADLRNNEYIVYNENQSTIKYLVEIS